MKIRQLCGMAALGAAAASLALGAPAHAELETYAASAKGRALELTAFQQSLTIGDTTAEASSTGTASAIGIGVFTPGGEAGRAEATQTGDGTNGSATETCEGAFPPDVPAIAGDAACGSALATVTGGAPSAVATGRVGKLVVNPVEPILATPLQQVVEPVEGAVEQLLTGLEPITTPVEQNTGLGAQSTLKELFEKLFNGADLLTVTLGKTTSSTEVTDSAVISRCVAEGARVDLLDAEPVAGAVDPEPVMSIIIGGASTEVSVSRTDATATPTVNPAAVRVIVPSLNIDQAVGPGGTADIPLPDPLASRIIGADGATGVTDDGQTFAEASAVKLELATGDALQGGVVLALADCASFAGGVAVQPTTTVEVLGSSTTAGELPRTGGAGPASPLWLGSAGVLGVAGLVLLRRTALAG